MAVEHVDIGAFIAGAIDRFYEDLDREQAWFEAECRRAEKAVDALFEDFHAKLKSGEIVLEADFDDEGDEAAKWLAQNDPSQRAAQPAAQSDASAQPKVRKPRVKRDPAARPAIARRDSTDYRRGYKTGWKAAHSGHPAAPDAAQGEEYVRGYQDGHKISGHANAVVGHYNAALQAHNAGDHETAKAHVAKTHEHVGAVTQHFLPDWVAQTAHKRGLPHDQAAEDVKSRIASQSMPTVKRAKRGGVPLAGARSALVGAIYDRANDANAAPDDDENHVHHPANFGDHLSRMMGGYAAMEKRKEYKRAAKGHGGEGGDEEGGYAPERAAQSVNPEMLAQAKEQLARQAYSDEEFNQHVAEHGSHPLEHHQSLEAATQAAAEHWKHRAIKHIQKGQADGVSVLQKRKVDTGARGTDGSPITTDFDPARALIDTISHPRGAYARGSLADAHRNQISDYNGRSHPSHPGQAMLWRAGEWLAQHPHFDPKGPMVKASQQAASGKIRKMSYGGGYHAGLRQQGGEEVAEQMIDIFEAWLRENVELSEEQLSDILESVHHKATERLVTLVESA